MFFFLNECCNKMTFVKNDKMQKTFSAFGRLERTFFSALQDLHGELSKGRVSQDYELRRLSNHYGYSFYSFSFVGLSWRQLCAVSWTSLSTAVSCLFGFGSCFFFLNFGIMRK